MVKGISRRVVVVRPPDSSVFEEAIFVMRECRDDPPDVLREACKVAEKYLHAPAVRRYYRRRFTSIQLVLSAILGGSVVGIAWTVSILAGIFF